MIGSCTGKGKGRDYLLKPAGMFFAFGGEISRSMESLRTTAPRNPFVQSNKVTVFFSAPGLCTFVSLEVMRQSVKRMIESEETIWIEYYYSWSFACACAGFVILFVTGITLLILSMPHMPRNPWETCMDAEPEQVE